MSFCFLYNVVSEDYSVQNSPWGRGGYSQLKVYNIKEDLKRDREQGDKSVV